MRARQKGAFYRKATEKDFDAVMRNLLDGGAKILRVDVVPGKDYTNVGILYVPHYYSEECIYGKVAEQLPDEPDEDLYSDASSRINVDGSVGDSPG